jgi:hypothetical protein
VQLVSTLGSVDTEGVRLAGAHTRRSLFTHRHASVRKQQSEQARQLPARRRGASSHARACPVTGRAEPDESRF